MKTPWGIVSVLVFCLFTMGVTYSQNAPAPNANCSSIQNQALQLISQNKVCSGLGKAQACYGAQQITAVPRVPTDDFFTRLDARQPLSNFASIVTQGTNTGSNWGVALLNLGILSDTTKDVELILTGNSRLEDNGSSSTNTATFTAFYFNTENSSCTEAPASVSIRVPQNVHVDLNVNGANMNVGSLVVLRTVPPGNVMRIYTVSGSVVLQQTGGLSPVTVPTGFVAERCLSEPRSLGINGQPDDQTVYDSCTWTPAVAASPEDIAIGVSIQKTFDSLDGAPLCQNGGQSYTHTVSRGENLFRIAQRYSKTVAELAAENNITNPDVLYAGMQLQISCGIDRNTRTYPICPVSGPCY